MEEEMTENRRNVYAEGNGGCQTGVKAPVLAIVVPCYYEEEVLPETNRRLTALLEEMCGEGLIARESYVLYVNDGSRDRTWELIEGMNATSGWVCGLNLAGNVGHQHALRAGLEAVKERCDFCISMDADLQDDPNAMREMVKKALEGCDIVYGVRRERKTDTWFKRNTALAFYGLMKHMGVKSVYNHADYRLMSSRAVQQLCRYKERNLFLRGLVPLLGYRTDCVYYDREERFAGESKYPLSKMVNFAIDGITSFSVKPVRMIFWLGCIFLLIALLMMVYACWEYFHDNTYPGWASLMVSLWFIGGAVLVALGIVGEYIGKIYIEVKERPQCNPEKLLWKKETL